MALEKTITLENGFDVSYWTVKEITVDLVGKRVVAFLVGYKDKATKEAGAEPAISKFFEIPLTANEKPAIKTLRNWLMKQVKAKRVEYADAVELDEEELEVAVPEVVEEPVVEETPTEEPPV